MSNLQRTALGVLLAITSIMSGCSEESPPKESPQKPPVQSVESDLQLRTILNKEAPPEKKRTPIQSVLYQTEWELSNSDKVTPSEQHVIWETTFLLNSVVMLQVPVSDPWYNFVFLTQKGQEWTMVGLVDLHVKKESLFTNKEGLDLPMESYVISKLSIGSEEHKAWTIANDKQQVVIGSYPHTMPFSVLENAKSVQVKEIEAWYVDQGTGSPLLYYIDQGYVVWVTGNLNENELISLARSLPSATFYAFPFPNPTSS